MIRRLLAASVFVLVYLCAQIVDAAPIAITCPTSSGSGVTPIAPPCTFSSVLGLTPDLESGASSVTGTVAGATGVVTTNFGLNKLFLSGGSSGATSQWLDAFTMLGGSGQGTATFMWALSGMVTAPASCSGFQDPGVQGTYSSQVNGTFTALASFNTGCPAGPTSFGVSNSGSILVNFTYGVPFDLGLTLFVLNNAGGIADFSHTGQLTSVVIPVGASLVSASGTTYSTVSAVPEPASVTLTALGIAGIVARYRYRRRTAGSRIPSV